MNSEIQYKLKKEEKLDPRVLLPLDHEWRAESIPTDITKEQIFEVAKGKIEELFIERYILQDFNKYIGSLKWEIDRTNNSVDDNLEIAKFTEVTIQDTNEQNKQALQANISYWVCEELNCFGNAFSDFCAEYTQFRGERTLFDNAEFHGESTSFRNVEFRGESTSFSFAKFHGKETSFYNAKFYGERTLFDNAEFYGERTLFWNAQFNNSKEISFWNAQFNSKKTLFDKALFKSKETSFEYAEFHGAKTLFRSIKFQDTSFEYSKFHGKGTSFRNAEFHSIIYLLQTRHVYYSKI